MSETCFDQDTVQRETEERLETEAVNMIIERLLDLKPSLYWHYTREVWPRSRSRVAFGLVLRCSLVSYRVEERVGMDKSAQG